MMIRSYRWKPAGDQEEAQTWLATYHPIYVSNKVPLLGPGGSQEIWAGRIFVLSQTSCAHAELVRGATAVSGRAVDHFALQVVMGGFVEIHHHGGTVTARAGDLLLLDLQAPVRLIRGTDNGPSADLTLWIPRASLPAKFADLTARHDTLAKAAAPGASVVSAALQAMLAQVHLVTAAEMDEIASGIALLAVQILTLEARRNSAVEPSDSPPLDSFVIISRYIENHLAAKDLSADSLVKTFGLSRASLYRLFEPTGGVASYIRARRLARVQQEITAGGLGNRRIAPIAYRYGFRSIPAFNRAFKSTYGQTPREALTAKRSSLPSPAGSSHALGQLAQWLLDIS
ncbi:helix-turn-helix domain-containing protein [Bradyrhizobium neotropicale]|uniref:helix-turn-helix domain-containing protein n=1 Tax=Bradyrhizobium neotropicale TaxID=1497615 RepID=UPI001AD7C69B|nr:helix-turn-helix domain-containing protein [Bradyrhizobium neotropicale]MBO4221544.1 helix-turn-helix domain-containing protein [Bradyrhizobium neotropicale]